MGLSAGRDFLGYGRNPPQARWPGDARIAVSFVVNFEEGAEFAISDGDPANEAVYEVTHRVERMADLCLDSHFEYGSRAGWWRVMNVFDEHGAKATVSACGWGGRAHARTGSRRHRPWPRNLRPRLAMGEPCRHERDGGARSHRPRGSGDCGGDGKRPVGWHTRSSASPNTRRLLMEEGGSYDSDAYNDDLPFVVGEPDKPHVVLPYAFDTNDMQFLNTNRFARPADFVDYVLDAFDALRREGAHAPKMMSVGLHLRIIGRPGRIGALERILAAMRAVKKASGLRDARTSRATG